MFGHFGDYQTTETKYMHQVEKPDSFFLQILNMPINNEFFMPQVYTPDMESTQELLALSESLVWLTYSAEDLKHMK